MSKIELTQEAAIADQIAAYQAYADAERRKALTAAVHPPRIVLIAAATDDEFKRKRVERAALHKRVHSTFGPDQKRKPERKAKR